MIQYLQRGHQLAAEETRPTAFPGQGGQRLYHPEVAGAGAVARLQSPDAGNHPGPNPVALFHLRQQRPVRRDSLATIGDALVANHKAAITRPCHGEFGLVTVPFQHFLIRDHIGEGAIQGRRPYPRLARFRPDIVDEAVKTVLRRRECVRGEDRWESAGKQETAGWHGALSAMPARAGANGFSESAAAPDRCGTPEVKTGSIPAWSPPPPSSCPPAGPSR